MSSVTEVEASFSALGGMFLVSALDLAARLDGLRGLVLDWDGVFNAGIKGEGVSSTFNEPDSMGVNLLRYALWRARGELPVTALITGEDNPAARGFAVREHLHAVYSGVKNKAVAIEELCAAHDLRGEHFACVFDDVNDLGMAQECGVRILVRRDSSPMLSDYVARHDLCDYITAARSHEHAVREAAELLLGLMGVFDQVVASRVAWSPDYARYFALRQRVETRFDTGTRVRSDQL